MRFLVAILLIFLMNLDGCVNQSFSIGKEFSKTDSIVFVDSVEANLMNLYNAAAETRHAVQPDGTVCTTGLSMRVLPNRTRTVSNVSIRQVLLSTHKPAVSGLIHHSITQLVAFPKEYHVFQLRRILI